MVIKFEGRIADLEGLLEKEKQDSQKLTNQMQILHSSYKELEQDKKDIIKDMRQNEILHEKDIYKHNAKLKEYKYIIHE